MAKVFEGCAKRDGITIYSNMCQNCQIQAQADGWQLSHFLPTDLPTVEPCDWCSVVSSVPDFHPPYAPVDCVKCFEPEQEQEDQTDPYLRFSECLTDFERNRCGVF